MTRKNRIILSLAFFALFFAFSASAQIRTDDIVLSMSPQYPRANTKVQVSISSYMVDLNRSMITWSVNGLTINRGVGKKDFYLTTDETGAQTLIEVKIETLDGSSISKKIAITPTNMDLLWEAPDSYVPPFYRGKALVPREGFVKVVAIPNSPSAGGFSYNWSLDNNSKIDSSGYGKNSFSYKNNFLDANNTVNVKILNLYGNSVGESKITIQPWEPKLLFYKKDPILGTKWEYSLPNGFVIDKGGITLVLEPYFFTPKNLNSAELYLRWFLDDNAIPTPAIRNELSIKPSSKESGSSNIRVTLQNLKALFLNTEKTLNVGF